MKGSEKRKDVFLDLEGLAELKSQLDLAIESGFSVASPNSSPVLSTLIEIMMDLSLKLRNKLQEGRTPWQGRKNPGIKFLDQADELGNFKSIKLKFPQQIGYDPRLSKYFENLAQELSQIRRLKGLPEHLYRSDKPEARQEKRNKSSYHFHRRLRQRRKR